MKKSDLGVYGLGVMGRNLALNLEEHGNRVSVYNRQTGENKDLLASFIKHEGKEKMFSAHIKTAEFVSSLSVPRKILIMVKAGTPVDDVIDELAPHLEKGDILIDGGNSHFEDTDRRSRKLTEAGIHYVGMGISGGEEGARHGPSMMPGTTPQTWDRLKQILEPIAATAFDGSPCCSRVGSGGSGHFVKMVHNGIEYADMQLIAEVYHIMRENLQMSMDEISGQIARWNQGLLSSYLIEITSEILKAKDKDGEPLVEKVLDSAGQKGTGKWTAITALEYGIHLPGITQAVAARFISAFTGLRHSLASEPQPRGDVPAADEREQLLSYLEDALLASRIICHSEGFFMITKTSREKKWEIDPAEVARIWQGGCIIRSKLLKNIVTAFNRNTDIEHLLQANEISDMLGVLRNGWRAAVSHAALAGIPAPVMMASLSQYDSLRAGRLPANLIQAQRDYFGAHTYERVDRPRDEFFHTDWSKSSESQ